MNGCLQAPGDQDWFVFAAKKDQALEFRLIARSVIRSPLDGVVEVHKFDGGRLASNDDSGGGPDAAFSFKAPADGKYAVCVKDHLNKGGPHFSYRLEIEPPSPKLITTIKEQERYMSQTIPVPRGSRMAVDVLLDRKFVSGVTEIVIPDLPPGLEQVKAVVAENSNHAQLMLRAKSDASNVGKLVDLSARLKKDGDKEALIGHMDQRTQIVRGQNNRDVWGINSDKLAVAVLDPIAFDIEVVQPQVPLVRDGTMPLIVKAKRQPGFTRAIRLKVLDTPLASRLRLRFRFPRARTKLNSLSLRTAKLLSANGRSPSSRPAKSPTTTRLRSLPSLSKWKSPRSYLNLSLPRRWPKSANRPRLLLV